MKRLYLNIIVAVVAMLAPVSAQAAANYDKQAAVDDTVWYDTKDYAAACKTTPGSTSTGPTSTLQGADHVSAAYNFLVGKGFTPQQAAGIVGNMILESGIGPQRLEGTAVTVLTPYDKITVTYPTDGWGIVQWTPHTKIGDWAQGKDPNNMAVQLDFLWYQLNNDEKTALIKVQATSTPDDAAVAWGQYYERPGDLSASIVDRQVNAIAVYEFMTSGTPLPANILSQISNSPLDNASGGGGTTASPAPAASPAPGTNCTATQGNPTGAAAGIYKNPYRDIPGLVPLRIDGGVDYGGGDGPIYAVGNGVITSVHRGVSPDNWVTYKLTDGPAAGLSIYLAEDCTFPVNVGDHVTADTVICNYHWIGFWTETGWYGDPNSSFGMKYGFFPGWYDGVVPQTGLATNTGMDMNRFLVSIGTPPGVLNPGGSNGLPPADWPKW